MTTDAKNRGGKPEATAIAHREASVARASDPRESLLRQQIEQALKAWLAGKSKHTVRAMLGDLRCFATFVRGSRVNDPVDAALALVESGQLAAEAAISDWRAGMKDRGLQPTTISRRLTALRGFASTMRRFGLGWDLSDVHGPSYSPYDRAMGPEAEDIEITLAHLEQEANGHEAEPSTLLAARDYAMIVVLYHTAMRRASLIGLTWDEVHVGGGRPYARGVVKGGKTRRFPLSKRSIAALERWRSLRVAHLGPCPTDSPVFVNTSGPAAGQAMSGDGVYKRTRHHLGSGPHGIRHSAASKVYDERGNLKLVQDLLGHANAATTQAYMDKQGHSAEEAMRVLAGEDPR